MRRSLGLIVCIASLSACGEPAPCPSGTWDDDGDGATECVAWSQCEAGEQVAQEGSATHDRRCAGCPSGTLSSGPNAASCVAWTTCEAGTRVAREGSATRDRECASCPAGTDTSGPNQSSCVPLESCAPGTVQTVPGSRSMPPVCEACAAGQHCPGGELPAVDCGDGDETWDHDADPSTACVARTDCVAGSYVATAGDATTDRSCVPCASGTYTSGVNEASCAEWSSCPAGEHVTRLPSATADRTCEACPAGSYTSGPNQSTCVEAGECAPGTTQSVPATPTAPPVCDACVAGEHCPGGTAAATACGASAWDHDADPATACAARTDCGPGQHIDDDGSATTDRTCAACAAGTYSAAMNAPSCTPWTLCDAGYLEGAPGTDTMDRSCVPLWTRQFGTSGDDLAYSVIADGSGNVIVAGYTEGVLPGQTSAGSDDVFVRKYDGAGSLLWTRQFGAAFQDYALSVTVDGSGNVIVAGATYGALPGQTYAGYGDAFVRKYDTDGTELWTRQFGTASEERPYSVTVDGSGNVIVAGHTGGTLPGQTSAGFNDAFVRKYNASGSLLWTRQFGSADFERAYSVTVDGSGSVIVAGSTSGTLPGQTSLGGFSDAFIRKYDADGTDLWTRQFGTASTDSAQSVSVDGSGNVLVAGGTSGTLPGQTSAGDHDAFVRRYDADGSVVWTRQFGSSGGESALEVSVDGSGNVLVAGNTNGTLPGQTTAGARDAFVRKYDAAGIEVWTRQFGTAAVDYAHSVSADGSGSVLVAGTTSGALPGQSSAGDTDAFVIKLLP